MNVQHAFECTTIRTHWADVMDMTMRMVNGCCALVLGGGGGWMMEGGGCLDVEVPKCNISRFSL